jgi:hypothetical protein
MKEIEDEVETFRINVLLILKNFILVSIILIAFSIFSKEPLHMASYLILIVGGLYLLYNIISETLTSVNVYKKEHKVNFQFSRFIFIKSEFTLGTNEFFYSFEEEVGARGSRHSVFNAYNADKEKIIKITPYSSGWRTERIMSVIFLWKELGVKEYEPQ